MIFYDDEALEKIYNAFEPESYWLVNGTNHTKDDGNSFIGICIRLGMMI